MPKANHVCYITNSKLSPPNLLRLVLSPAGDLVLDNQGKLKGKIIFVSSGCLFLKNHYYILRERLQLTEAEAEKLCSHIDFNLKQEVIQWIRLAAKARAVTIGIDNIKTTPKKAKFFLVASGNSNYSNYRFINDANSSRLLSSIELSAVLGKGNVNFAAITDERFAERLTEAIARYEWFVKH